MPSKRQREQLSAARAASVELFKKRRLEASSVHNLLQQPSVHNDKPNTIDTSPADTSDEEETATWFWNESANETDSDEEEEDVGEGDGKDLEEQSKTEQAVSHQASQAELKWKKDGENNLRGGYRKGSKSTQMRHNKSARDLEKEASKTYNIQALWQRSRDLGITSRVNSPVGLEQSRESSPINSESSTLSLSQIPRGCSPPLSQRQIERNQREEALKDLTRLLNLVTEQEKKYQFKLSPHSNFYRRHLMVQQFLQIQLKSQPSQSRRELSLTISRAFGRGHHTSRSIVQWENSWVHTREIPERKERSDGESWMYDEDVNNAIKEFTKAQGDSKF